MTMFAVDMASKYEDGFLPGPGGWLNQDAFYVKLINEALFARRERERIEQQKQAAEAKLKAARSKRR